MAQQDSYHLGEISERYESIGPGTISTGKGDHGGVSYGTYQLSTASGTIEDYLEKSRYKENFKDLSPNTKAFNDKWHELASKETGFAQDQHDFIKSTHYDPQVSRLKADGLDLTGRGTAVQEALWSTSVQYKNLTKNVFEGGLKEKFGDHYKLSDLTDKDIVGAVQDYKIAHNEQLFRRSKEQWGNLHDRAVNEKEDLMALADGRPLPTHAKVHTHAHSAHSPDVLKQGSRGQEVSQLQTQLGELGYLDNTPTPDGKFGPATMAAVKSFQHDHHLPEVGQAGPETKHAIQADLQPLKRDDPGLLPAVPAMSSLPVGKPGLDDPRNALNPDHALFNKLKELIPDASEQRLLQFTAACHTQKITDQNLGGIRMDRDAGVMHFGATKGLEAHTASVDLKELSPPPAQSIQQIQQFDQHQAQIATQSQAQIQAQNAQASSGPVLGGAPTLGGPGH